VTGIFLYVSIVDHAGAKRSSISFQNCCILSLKSVRLSSIGSVILERVGAVGK
jgi:hypothetical protein